MQWICSYSVAIVSSERVARPKLSFHSKCRPSFVVLSNSIKQCEKTAMNQIWCILMSTMSILMCMASGIAVQQVEKERRAIARLSDEKGGTMGVLHFLQRVSTGPVHITGSITGLEPGKHGIHVHANGDCTEAGLHFQQRHGLPTDPNRHVGDLGNILASADGVAIVDIVDEVVSLNGPHNIIGRSIIIDSVEDLGLPEDDPPVLPPHVACGIIGVIQA